jgi:uncharacterized membrane protein
MEQARTRTTPTSIRVTPRQRSGPLIAAGTLLGLGMGGFIDGILLHQILQWHQMISNRLPPNTLTNKEINMFWDGIFHAGTWTFTALGIALLWRVAFRPDVIRSTTVLVGSLIMGWGLFNAMDSIANHYIFAFHNVRENVANPQVYNHAFLGLAIVQIVIGWLIIQQGRKNARG